MQQSNIATNRQPNKAIEKLHAFAWLAWCFSQNRGKIVMFRLVKAPLHIAPTLFLLFTHAPLVYAQTTQVTATQPQTSINEFSFSIPAQNANEALTELAKQANTTLLFPFDLAKKVKTNALEGTFTLNEALSQLLKDTELAVVVDEAGMLSIRSRSSLLAKANQANKEEKASEEGNNGLEKIAVVGTRNAPRSAVDSPVPLDVIGSKALRSQGNSDVLSMLSVMVPSLNVNDQPINDASSLVRPANLR
ncbi:MAG: STN domain-containing protein, partial [Pseudomonadota bacterium]|nr:STN domain-containing protein [Pseudomonadota bacterium]